MEMTVKIGGKDVPMKTSGATPIKYRKLFNREIFIDIAELQKGMAKQPDGTYTMPVNYMEIFEDMAYCFAKHADPTIPDNIEEWAEQFEVFDISTAIPQLLTLWAGETKTTARAKKKNE